MNENQALEVLKEVAVQNSKEVYADGLKPAVQEGGGALAAIVGLFNNVVLYPVKKANLTFKYKLEMFEQDLKVKTDRIPLDRLIEPPLMIAGPTLEALKYTYDEKELREMYVNLLASSMNSDTVNKTHPAYVDTIKQMSPLDAVVFKEINKYIQIRCVLPNFSIVNTNKAIYPVPKYITFELEGLGNYEDLSVSLLNIQRLGLIDILDATIVGMDYEQYNNHPYISGMLSHHNRVAENVRFSFEKQTIRVNDFGRCFALVCIA